MAVWLHRVGAVSARRRRTWTPRDCSLYALGVGAGFDDLEFVGDAVAGVDQRVYPTFVLSGVMAAESADWPDPAFQTGDFPLERVVHGQQALILHRPVLPHGDVTTWTRVAGIHDKRSGALIVLEVHAVDTSTAEPVFTARTGLFVTGEGGFGGEPEPGPPADTPAGSVPGAPPERPPDHRVEHTTLPIQTLLWRHAGNDPNPVHVDPAFARRAGFPGPILSGLNTLGFACRALVDTVAGREPTRLAALAGRFSAPAANGDVLVTEVWDGGTDVWFRTRNQDGATVVDRGRATIVDGRRGTRSAP
jgi:acyl dehydratase